MSRVPGPAGILSRRQRKRFTCSIPGSVCRCRDRKGRASPPSRMPDARPEVLAQLTVDAKHPYDITPAEGAAVAIATRLPAVGPGAADEGPGRTAPHQSLRAKLARDAAATLEKLRQAAGQETHVAVWTDGHARAAAVSCRRRRAAPIRTALKFCWNSASPLSTLAAGGRQMEGDRREPAEGNSSRLPFMNLVDHTADAARPVPPRALQRGLSRAGRACATRHPDPRRYTRV